MVRSSNADQKQDLPKQTTDTNRTGDLSEDLFLKLSVKEIQLRCTNLYDEQNALGDILIAL